MSSRDGSGRSGGNYRPPSQRSASPGEPPRRTRQGGQWDIDPAEIDRYLSGRPTREQESAGGGRSFRSPSQDTARQLDQLQRRRSQTPRPSQRPERPAPTGRQHFVEPEPDIEDVYDPYLPADDEYGYDDDADMYDPPAPARRQPARPDARRQARRPVSRQETVYDEYDDELYADDPYLTYDDDYSAPAPAARRPRSRPQVAIGKPNLPKLTVPRAIADAEIVNDRPSLMLIGAAIVSLALMAIVVSNRIDQLPAIIPTHVSATGVGEALKGRNALWSVPILAAALSLMNIAAGWFVARLDLFAARYLLGASLLVHFIAWVALIKYLW